jgi:hypothetical protein
VSCTPTSPTTPRRPPRPPRSTPPFEALGTPEARAAFHSNLGHILNGWTSVLFRWRHTDWCLQCGRLLHPRHEIMRDEQGNPLRDEHGAYRFKSEGPERYPRAYAHYCSNARRQKAYRERKKARRRLPPGRNIS